MKKILFLLLVIPLLAQSQTEFDAIRVYDSARIDGEARYGADLFPYSSDLVLVDYGTLKGYVDTAAGGSTVTYTDGVTEISPGVVGWGGTATNPITVDFGGNNLGFSNYGFSNYGGDSFFMYNQSFTQFTTLGLDGNSMKFEMQDFSSLARFGISIDTSGMKFYDRRPNSKSFEYEDPLQINDINDNTIPWLGLVIDSLNANIPTLTASGGVVRVGDDFRLGSGTISGFNVMDGQGTASLLWTDFSQYSITGNDFFLSSDNSSRRFVTPGSGHEIYFTFGNDLNSKEAYGLRGDNDGFWYFDERELVSRRGIEMENVDSITPSDTSLVWAEWVRGLVNDSLGVYVTESQLNDSINDLADGVRDVKRINYIWNEVSYSATINANLNDYVLNYTELTGDATINMTSLPLGITTYILEQDATGGRVITIGTGWGTKAEKTGDFDTDADAKNHVQFIKYWDNDITYFINSTKF